MSEPLWNDEMIKPIQHLRVIDFTEMLAGPYLTRILAQFGAEVIKVEKCPSGDLLRSSPDFGDFEFLNQGKKSICLNAEHKEGKEIVKTLAAEADIFVENFGSEIMEELGLGYADLAEKNWDLIYLSLQDTVEDSSGVEAVGGVYAPLIKLLIHLINPNRRGMHLIGQVKDGPRDFYLSQASWAGFSSHHSLSPCPALGQDTYSISHALGYSNEKISQLMASGILIQEK